MIVCNVPHEISVTFSFGFKIDFELLLLFKFTKEEDFSKNLLL